MNPATSPLANNPTSLAQQSTGFFSPLYLPNLFKDVFFHFITPAAFSLGGPQSLHVAPETDFGLLALQFTFYYETFLHGFPPPLWTPALLVDVSFYTFCFLPTKVPLGERFSLAQWMGHSLKTKNLPRDCVFFFPHNSFLSL